MALEHEVAETCSIILFQHATTLVDPFTFLNNMAGIDVDRIR